MKLKYLAGAVAAALVVAASPAAAERAPSQHVRCDGNPDNMSAGETAARLIAITAVVGLLVPPPEQADASQRLSGAEGVAACDAVLAVESNDMRRAQLILARAIHRIEAGEFEAAIADARLTGTDRPEFAATTPFRLSLRLSALEIEAMALLAMGRRAQAVAKAIEMAEAAPYDLVNMLRAMRYVRLSDSFGAGEQGYYERLIRLYPVGVLQRAFARENAGDFRGAADDYELWVAIARTVTGEQTDRASLARAALARALAGENERAAELAERARATTDPDKPTTPSPAAEELLDLYRIWQTARAGRAGEARIVFAGRSSWSIPTPAAVAGVVRLLREGARPEELTGPLARDAEAYRTEPMTRLLEQMNSAKDRYTAIRPFTAQSAFNAFSRNVWNAQRSRYANADNEDLDATFVSSQRDGAGVPSGYAVLLHSALVARSRGKSEFMLLPGQRHISSHFVRFGAPGDANMIAPLTLNAERVIADLGPLIPTQQQLEGQQRSRRRR